MYTVNNIFTSALRAFSGVSENSFLSPNGIIEDAVRAVSNNIQIVENKRTVPLLPALYTGDNLYPAPSDLDNIIGFYPYNNAAVNTINKAAPLTINRDTYNTGTNFATEYRNGVKMIRVQPGYVIDTPIILHACDSTTADGTVAVSGDGSNLDINEVMYLNGTASLDFDITASGGSATITFTGITARDISTITRDGAFSLGMFIPAGLEGNVTSISLKVGTDASNYYEMTATTTAYGAAFIHGFNIVRFERRGATETGTVDEEDITFLESTLTHTLAAATEVAGIKFDAIAAHKGIGYQLEYYSGYYFIDKTTGAFKQSPTDNGMLDQVTFGKEVFELAVREAQKIMDHSLRGGKAGTVYQAAERDLNGIWGDFSNPGMYENYRLKFPSERRSTITSYL